MASRSLGTLTLDLIAKIGGYVGGLTKAERATQKWRKQVKRDVEAVAKQFAVLSVGIATGLVAATVATVSRTKEAIDSQAKFADRIGISTEALGALQFAGDLTGVSINQLNLGLQRMTRRVAEAAQGLGEAKGALMELGLDAQALNRLSPDKQFEEIAEALGNVSSQSDRVRLAFKLFDSEGVALVNTLKLGKTGLQDVAKEAESLGISLSRVDAAQVEALNDALTRASAVGQGFSNRLTVEVAPAITAVANLYREAALESGGFGSTASLAGDIAETAIGAIGNTIQEIIIGIQQSRVQLAEFAADSLKIIKQLQTIGQSITFGLLDNIVVATPEDTQKVIDAFEDIAEASAIAFNKTFEDRQKNGNFSERLKRQIQEDRAALEESFKDIGSITAPDISANPALTNEQTAALKAFRSELEKAATPQEVYWKQLKQAQEFLKSGSISQIEYNNALTLYNQQLEKSTGANAAWVEDLRLAEAYAEAAKTPVEKLNEELQKLQDLSDQGLISDEVFTRTAERINAEIEAAGEKMEELSVYAEQAARNIQGAFADFFFDPFEDGLDGLLLSFTKTIRQALAQAAAADFASALNLPGSGGGGNVSAFLGAIGSAFGGARAAGGPVMGGKTYLVGEKGPELLTMPGNGNITPNNRLSEFGGGVTHINVNSAPNRQSGWDTATQIERERNRNQSTTSRRFGGQV